MQLSDVVTLTITKQNSALSTPGFGTPMISPPTVPAGFTERLRYFTNPADMLTAGFLSSDMAYKMAINVMSQRPHPQRFAVGRRTTAVAQTTTLTMVVANSYLYTFAIFDGLDSFTVSFTSDADATAAEVAAGINSAVNGTAVRVTATVVGTTVQLVADNAGIPFTVTESSPNISQATSVASTGFAESLLAITNEQPDWYCLLITERDELSIMAAAAAMSTQNRLFIPQSNDATILSAPYNESDTTTDVFSRLKALGYENVVPVYTPLDADSLDAAIAGRCISAIPGSLNWKFRQLTGISATNLDATQLANLRTKNGNAYVPLAGRSVFVDGKCSSGEFADNTHGLHKLASRMLELYVGALIAQDKVPFTQQGLDAQGTTLIAALQESTNDGLIAESRTLADGTVQRPAYSMTPPRVQDIPAGDRAARRIPSSVPYKFEATFSGAVNDGDIDGTFSY